MIKIKTNNVEIRMRTGLNQYERVLYPKTTSDNVMTSSNIKLSEELNNIKNVINEGCIISTSEFVSDSVTNIVTINNPNYIYKTSNIDVFHNGILIVNGVHYELIPNKEVKLIGYTSNVGDEFTFKIYNSLQCNIDTSYLTFPQDQAEAHSKLIDSITNYISDVNKFKDDIANTLYEVGIVIDVDKSFDEFVSKIKESIKNQILLPLDLGGIIGKPIHGNDIHFSLGVLFGIENDVEYFGNDLGILF